MLRVLALVLLAACATTGTSGGSDDDDDVQGQADARHQAGDPDGAPLVFIDASPPPPDATPPDASPPPELGRIGYWGGKVNTHKPEGTDAWQFDPDCSSGANIDTLTYCRKWFPATASVMQVSLTPNKGFVWYDASCVNLYESDGVTEYACLR